MRIFVLLSRIPYPLEKGDKLRAFNQVKQLSKHHEIILCALNTNLKIDKQKAFQALQPLCISINFIDLPKSGIVFNLFKAGINGLPLQTGYFYNSKAATRINKLIQQYQPDILYGQLLRVAEYIRKSNVPKAIDYQDVFSMGMKRRLDIGKWWMKPFFKMEYLRLKKYETAIFEDFDVKTIISEPDRQHIPHPKRDEILIIPNGVDHDFFKPQICEKKYDLVFTGNMGYPPNVNAVEYLANEILPLVWKQFPEVKMLIAGASPDPKVKKVAGKNIVVTGWLDDIRTAYAESKIFIAPMRIGTGLQNKLLEAMSMLLPTITTSLANGALQAKNNYEIMIGDSAQELANQIITLLSNQEKAQELAQAGFDFVHRNYNWKSTTEILEKALLKAVKQL